MESLGRPLGFEQRESAKVLVLLRWILLVALLAVVDYEPASDTRGFVVIGLLMGGAAALNLVFQWLVATRRSIPMWLPLAVGVYDAAAITAGIATIDGFDNTAYVLYYPALMAFSAVFPGRIGLTYCALIIGVYALLSVFIYERFDRTSAADWHDLGLRVSTLTAAAVLSYLLVRVERERRVRAVDAEAERQSEVQALQQRTIDLERAAEQERRRLLREVHDGVSQGVYMLSLGLEGARHDVGAVPVENGVERLDALVRLSKQTLLESRGLLFDLSGVMRGDSRLDALVQHQADEFRAITGIATSVRVDGRPGALPASTVAQLYRVIQESLANIYRHSGARSVEIELRQGASTALRITDDGTGFEWAEARGRGHGLRGMEERAATLGASFCVSSSPGAGTTIALTIPSEEVHHAHPRDAGR